jgi:hypothetical protein
VTFALAAVSACGGPGELGEACDSELAEVDDECVTGTLCTKTLEGDLRCQKACREPSDCASGESCNETTAGQSVCQRTAS